MRSGGFSPRSIIANASSSGTVNTRTFCDAERLPMRPRWSGLNFGFWGSGKVLAGFLNLSRQPARSGQALPASSSVAGPDNPSSQSLPRTTPFTRLSISPRITLSWMRQAIFDSHAGHAQHFGLCALKQFLYFQHIRHAGARESVLKLFGGQFFLLEQKPNVSEVVLITARHLGQDQIERGRSEDGQLAQFERNADASVQPIDRKDNFQFAEQVD